MVPLGTSFRMLATIGVLCGPLPCGARQTNWAQVLPTLPVDSLGGATKVYYSPGHLERARALQSWYGELVLHYERMFLGEAALDVTTDIAILTPEHWSAAVPLPYGLPNIDFRAWPRFIAFLPADNEVGLMADLFRSRSLPVDVGRAVDIIGLHEFGHGLAVKYLYVLAPGTDVLSVRWFDEFMATYLGNGYLWQTEGIDADSIHVALAANVSPLHTGLSDFDAHYSELGTPAGFETLAWYQAQFTQRAQDVFARQGLEFLRRVRAELPWDRYSTWRTDELLTWLEEIEPGFLAWAASLSPGGAAH